MHNRERTQPRPGSPAGASNRAGARPPVVAPNEARPADHERRLLRGLQVVKAEFVAQPISGLARQLAGEKTLALLHCVKGHGWFEVAGRLNPVRKGDVLALSPGMKSHPGSNRANPWSVHWIEAVGELAPDYLDALAPGARPVVIHAGEDPRFARLFSEILTSSRQGAGFVQQLHRSHALAYLLALLVHKRREAPRETGDVVNKIAEAILYMSDHLDQPLRVSELARMAGLSQAYFGELFKAQTGCAPRDYLHLLRIHKACQLLRETGLSIKEISVRAGYQDPFHFSRQFKAFQGVSPTAFRLRSAIPSC